MIALIRAKIFSAIRSKSFRFFAVIILLWVGFCTLTVFSGSFEVVNTGYLPYYILFGYLTLLPLAAASWYGMFPSSGFDKEVPFQVNDWKTACTGIISALIANAFLNVLIVAFCLLLMALPMANVEKSSPSDLAKLFLAFSLISFARTAFTCFFTEATHSRLGGALFGFGACTGLFEVFLLSVEVDLCCLLGISQSSLPIVSHMTYFIWEGMQATDSRELVMNYTNFHVIVPLLVVVTIFFSGVTVAVRHRRDVA